LAKIFPPGRRRDTPADEGVDEGGYKKVALTLRLNAKAVPDSAKGSASAQRVLRTLTTTVQNLSELRNELGTGHGRPKATSLRTRHARLALNSTITVTEFLLDTWHERPKSENG
jgi:hypothetical protein